MALLCALSFSPLVVTAQQPQVIETAQIGRPSIKAIDWNPTRDLIAVATAKDIWLYDTQLEDISRMEVQLGISEWGLNDPKQPIGDWNIDAVKWSPNGRWLMISINVFTADGKQQPNIWQIWDWDGTQFTRMMSQFPYITAIKWRPDAAQYALSSGNHIYLFDTTSQQIINTFNAIELSWSSDSQHLAFVMFEAVQVLNAQSLAIEASFTDIDAALRFALWNPDNTKLAAVGQNRLYVWDFVNKKVLVNLIHFFPNPYPEMGYGAFREPIRGIVWRPHSDQIAVSYNSIGGADFGRLSIWDVVLNKEIYSFGQGGRLIEMRWTPNGMKLMSSGASRFKSAGFLDLSPASLASQKISLPNEWLYSPSKKKSHWL